MNKDNIKSEVVFAGTGWQAEMVKSLLETEEIQAFIKDEIIGSQFPWYASGGGLSSVKVIVSSLDLERAKLIVAGYEKTQSEP